MNTIQDKAVLVSLSVSVWTARKTDKQANNVVREKFDTGMDATRTYKALVAKNQLEEITKIAGKLRTYHYEHTMPFTKAHAILTTELLPDYMAEVSRLSAEFNQSVEKLIDAYPAMRDQARNDLGGLFNDLDYPSEQQLRRKFHLGVDFTPVPDGSSLRISINEAELKEMQADIEAKVRDSVSAAMDDLWDRLYNVTNAIKEKFQGDKVQIFRDTLISNVKDLVDILPKMNFTNNPYLNDLADEIGRDLASYNPQELRESKGQRADAAKKAEEILAKIAAARGETYTAPAPVPEPLPVPITEAPKDEPQAVPEPTPEPVKVQAEAEPVFDMSKFANAGII